MPSPTPLPDCWGVDTSIHLTPDQMRKLAAAKLPIAKGQTAAQDISFVWQYIPRGGASASAETVAAAQSAVDAGLVLLLVQYGPPKDHWVVNADMGVYDGQAAAKWAQACGYPKGCHLAVDIEGFGSVGQPVREYLMAWAGEVHAAGYLCCVYQGYAAGLTADQYGNLDCIDLFWSDPAARTPPTGKGFACKQYWTIHLWGVDNLVFDPDHAFPDLVGRTLVGMGGDSMIPDPGQGLITDPGEPAA